MKFSLLSIAVSGESAEHGAIKRASAPPEDELLTSSTRIQTLAEEVGVGVAEDKQRIISCIAD